MIDQEPFFRELDCFRLLGYYLTIVTSIGQIIIWIEVLIVIWRLRHIDRLSINYQCLYLIVLASKCWDDYKVEHLEISAELDYIFKMRYWTKVFSLIAMMVTLLITVCFPKHEKFNIWWNAGEIIFGLVLACSSGSTAKPSWMIVSLTDLVPWIPPFKFFYKTKTASSKFFFVLMFLDHFVKLFIPSYDNYRNELYGTDAFKFGLISLLLSWWFVDDFMEDCTKDTNKVNGTDIFVKVSSGTSESPARDSTERCSEKSVYCNENEKDVSNKSEHQLISPN